MNLRPLFSPLLRRATLVGFALGLLVAAPSFAAPRIYVTALYAFDQYFPRLHAPGSSVEFGAPTFAAGSTGQWLHNDVPITGATGNTLLLSNLQSSDSGNYSLNVTTNGKVESSNVLTINVVPLPASAIDTSFSVAPAGFTGSATIMATLPDGGVILRDTGQNVPLVSRLDVNGNRDPNFSSASNTIVVLAVYPDGGLVTSNFPFRLNPDGTPRVLALPAGFDSSAPLSSALILADGRLVISQAQKIARLNIDDSVDTSFTTQGIPTGFRTVTKLELDPSGRIYVTVTEGTQGSIGSGTIIYRLTALGAEDGTFVRQVSGFSNDITLYYLNDHRILRRIRDFSGNKWNVLKDDGTVDPGWSAPLFTSGYNFVVDPVRFRVFFIGDHGIQRALITGTSLVSDPTFYQGDGLPGSLTLDAMGRLLAYSYYPKWDGHVSSGFVRMHAGDVVAVPAIATIGPDELNPLKGTPLTFQADAYGSGPLTYQWLALDGQPLPANSTTPNLTIANFDVQNFGRYQLRVSGPGGTILSNVTRVAFGFPPYLANLSGRAFVGTGDDTAIAGLAVQGVQVPLLLRGAGPALRTYGITNFLPNPVINLYNSANQLFRNNDNWGGGNTLRDAASSVGAFPFGSDSNDAALTQPLSTGNSSLQLTDAIGNSGVGLLEIYRLKTPASTGDIVNLSLRARTAPGERTATAGFVIADPQGFSRPLKLLLRVVGPALSQYGVAFPLPDPVLKLYNSAGDVIATNDNWSDNADPQKIADAAQQAGAFALSSGSKDSAVLLDLPGGVYSIQAVSAPDTPNTGVTLIEIYLVK
ncbi:MAG: Immunoglobulin I-set domain protein [Verrucomicrobia bacterium]|nr:Immunoglobulin I-set domain protein [Verrucomicrobiota bacterium]